MESKLLIRQPDIIGFLQGEPVYSVSGAHPTFTVDQTNFAFYNDGTESGATIIGSIGSDASNLDLDTVYQVRFEITETGGAGSNNRTWQLEAQVDGGTFFDVTGTSTNVRAAAGAVTDGEDTTQRLGGGGTFVGGDGVDEADGLAGGALNDWVGSEIGEVLFSFTLRSADLTGGEAINLRLKSMDAYTVADASLTVKSGVNINTNVDALTLTTFAACAGYPNTFITLGATVNDINLISTNVINTCPDAVTGDVTVDTNVDALILTEQQATVNAETNVNAGVDALTLTENQSTVNAETNVNANVANLTLTENQATIKADTSVSAGVDALTLTEQAADVNLDKFVSAGTVALTLTEQAATVNAETNVNTNINALVLTENQASIKADTNIAANVASLTLTENQSTVSLGVVVDATVVNLTLTEQSASVNAETNVNTNVDALALTENQASVKADTSISAGVDALTLTALQSGVNAETNVNTNIDALSLTTFSATVEAGTDTNVNASVANLTLTEQSARVNAGTNINAGIDVLILSENKANVSYIVDGETVTSSGGANFQARPTQEAIDKWLAQELDPNVPVKVKVREFAPQLEQSDPSLFEDLVSARQAIEQFQRPLLPSEIEKVRDGFVSITDLLPDYRLDETEEEAIVLLMMM